MIKSPLILTAFAAGLALAAGPAQSQTVSPASAAPAQSLHTISVAFDYDFRLTPACTPQVTKRCVRQFVVYDISSGASATKRYKLFIVPLPHKARGMVHGIRGKSPPLNLEPGKHLLGVTAQESGTAPNGESNPQTCTTWITVP